MASNSVPKNREPNSPAAPITAAEVTERIRQTLRGFAVPRNTLCEPCAVDTLNNAHEILELLHAIENAQVSLRSHFEMPEGGQTAIGNIRRLALDAIAYATELCNGHDNLRNAFDCGRLERVEAIDLEVAHG